LFLGVIVDLGELESGAAVGERGDRCLHDLGLELELGAETIDKLECQIAVVNRAADCGQIVSDALQLAGVGGDVEIAAWGRAESLAEEEVPGGLVFDEEAHEPGPGGAGAAVAAGDQAVEVVAQGAHEPQGDVDVQSHPYIIGDGRACTLGDVIQRLVHGEEEGDNLAPLGEVIAGGVYLELDVVGDMDIEDGVGWGYGVIGCWWTNGGGVVEVLAS
jgi:hypothetical protein